MRIKPLLFFRLSSVIQAIGYRAITYFVIYRLAAKEDVLLTYLLNIAAIILMLYIDGVAHRFAAKRANEIHRVYSRMGTALKAVFLLGQGFTRTAMYLFYIVVLVLSRIEALRPGIIPFELGDFFTSIEYGIILLFAFDTLKELFVKDKLWFKENLKIESQTENDKEE
jgi:hypothetical protein